MVLAPRALHHLFRLLAVNYEHICGRIYEYSVGTCDEMGKKPFILENAWVALLDIFAVNLSYFLALLLRYELGRSMYGVTESFLMFFSVFYRTVPWYTVLCLVLFFAFRLYNGLWRYAGINDLNRIIAASVITCILYVPLSLVFARNIPFRRMPISYYFMGSFLQLAFITAIRFSYRIAVIEKRQTGNKPGKALVVGAGDTGKQTVRTLQEGIYFHVCCIVDPDMDAVGKTLDGAPVFGWDQLGELITRYDITCVFLADPNLSEKSRQDINAICNEKKVEIRDYSSFFNFTGETDQFTAIETIVNAPEHADGKRKIPFSPPDIGEAEIGEVVDALNSGWITTGPRTKLLERRLAAYIETGKTDVDTESEIDRWKDRVVCLNSATASEELNLRILGVGPGDEVIVPAYTYTASASAAIHCGARVVFVDIQKDGDPVTHMPEMDYDALEAAIGPKTKAVVTVDLGGIVCDYERVFQILERKRALFTPLVSDGTPLGDLSAQIQQSIGRVAVVADSAHSLGASRIINGKRTYCGAIADFTDFSFHAVKNFTTAEGGPSTWRPIAGVDNAEIYKFYQLLSLHGQSKDALAKTKVGAWEYDIVGPWYKCNMTDIMAAIGLRQLDRYPGLLDRRVEIIKQYDAVCDELGLQHLVHHVEGMDSSNHLYLIRVPGADAAGRNGIIERLAQLGVSANVHYKPLPMMTAYKAMGWDIKDFSNAWDYYHNLFTIPLHTLLSDEDVEYICRSLREAVGGTRK